MVRLFENLKNAENVEKIHTTRKKVLSAYLLPSQHFLKISQRFPKSQHFNQNHGTTTYRWIIRWTGRWIGRRFIGRFQSWMSRWIQSRISRR